MTERVENTSGRGKESVLPDSLRGWNWGAFLLNWVWGIGNSTYVALLMFVPPVNLVLLFLLGVKGNKWAWANRSWRDEAEFRRVQRKWAIAGIVVIGLFVLGSGGLFFGITNMFKSSGAYIATMEQVRSDPMAVEVLGQPVEAGLLVTGQVSTGGLEGKAEMAFSVEGPKAGGMVFSKAIREDGKWRLLNVILVVPEVGAPMDITPKAF